MIKFRGYTKNNFCNSHVSHWGAYTPSSEFFSICLNCGVPRFYHFAYDIGVGGMGYLCPEPKTILKEKAPIRDIKLNHMDNLYFTYYRELRNKECI